MKELICLTLKQVSELLKVHPNTLRNWDKMTPKPIRIANVKYGVTRKKM